MNINIFFRKNQNLLLYITSIVFSVIIIIIMFAISSERDKSIFFSSDGLYLPSVYKDVFIDGTGFKGWHFNAAPTFFPDMFFYFILMLLTNNFIISSFLYSIIQYIVILLLIYVLFKNIFPEYSLLYATLVNLLMISFFLIRLVSNDYYLAFLLISNAYHLGAFIMCIICLILTIKYFKSKSKYILILLFVFIFIGTFCDKLFIVLYSIPALSFFILILSSKLRKQTLIITICNIISTISALIAFKQIADLKYIYFDQPCKMMDFCNIGNSYNVFILQLNIYMLENNIKTLILYFVPIPFSTEGNKKLPIIIKTCG